MSLCEPLVRRKPACKAQASEPAVTRKPGLLCHSRLTPFFVPVIVFACLLCGTLPTRHGKRHVGNVSTATPVKDDAMQLIATDLLTDLCGLSAPLVASGV